MHFGPFDTPRGAQGGTAAQSIDNRKRASVAESVATPSSCRAYVRSAG
jgi:hypothetical protein